MSAKNLPSRLSLKEQSLFFLPLAITTFLTIITHSLFNAGMARLPNPESLIAAFAVAKSLTHIYQSPTMMIRQTVTALVDHGKNFKKPSVFLGLISLTVVFLLAVTAFTGLSRLIFSEIMGIRGDTLDSAVLMLHILCLFPGMVAIRDYFSGFAIKFRNTPLITAAAIARIAYVLIFISLLGYFSAVPAPYLASLMFLGAVFSEVIILIAGTYLKNKGLKRGLAALDAKRQEFSNSQPKLLSYRHIAFFFAPLFATTLMMTTVMPIINGFLARTVSPDRAISVFAVAWGLGMIVLSPFIMFHQVPLNYLDQKSDVHRKAVQRFALLIASLSSAVMALLGFTPLGYFILTRLIGASHDISVLAADVIQLMVLLPFLMVAREYYWGLLMKRRTTKFIWKGKAINLSTLIVTLLIMTVIDPVNPAINGAVGIIACELSEFLYLYKTSRKMARQARAEA